MYCVYRHIDIEGNTVYIGQGGYHRPINGNPTKNGSRKNPRTVAHADFIRDSIQTNRRYWEVLMNNLSKEEAYEIEQLLIDMEAPKFNVPKRERMRAFLNTTHEQKSARTKGKKWYTDGTTDKRLLECPDGWTEGRSNFKIKRRDSYECK